MSDVVEVVAVLYVCGGLMAAGGAAVMFTPNVWVFNRPVPRSVAILFTFAIWPLFVWLFVRAVLEE